VCVWRGKGGSVSLSLSLSDDGDEQNRTATTNIKWRRAPEKKKARRLTFFASLPQGHGEEETQAEKCFPLPLGRWKGEMPKKKYLGAKSDVPETLTHGVEVMTLSISPT